MLSVPLVEVGDGTVHIHCEGEHGFFVLYFTTALHGFRWVLSTANAGGILQLSTVQAEG